MNTRRIRKRHTVAEVSALCQVSERLIREYETGQLQSLDLIEFISLAQYYGREVLRVPFTVHPLETKYAEVYFMYIRNGEPVQYAAKMAFKLITKEK